MGINEIFAAIRPTSREEHIPGPAITTKLDCYQRRTCHWMMQREKNGGETVFEDPCCLCFRLEKPSFFEEVDGFPVDRMPSGEDGESDDLQKEDEFLWYDRFEQQFWWSARHPRLLPEPCGGILADEMGLGKTLMMLALIDSHRRILEGDRPQLNEFGLIRGQASLVVVPANLMYQWQREVKLHCSSLTIFLYHGTNPIPAKEMARYDLVVTIYNVLHREARTLRFEKRYGIPSTPLLKIELWRLIVDEAQMVEKAISNPAMMAKRISASCRWCVTGTPIGHKGTSDLHGLFDFLGYEPFDNKRKFETLFIDHPHMPKHHHLLEALRHVLWRHSHADNAAEISLPELEQKDVLLKFSSLESETYAQEFQRVRRDVDASRLENGDALLYANMLRRACHPQIVLASGPSIHGHGQGVINRHVFQKQSAAQIALILQTKALDDAVAAEREYCMALNRLAFFFLSVSAFGGKSSFAPMFAVDRAKKLLFESWSIIDMGFENAQDKLKQISFTKIEKSGMKIATSTLERASWLRVEALTAGLMQKLCQIQQEHFEKRQMPVPRYVIDNGALLQSDLVKLRDEFLDVAKERVNNKKVHIAKIENEIIPIFFESGDRRAVELAHRRIKMGQSQFDKEHEKDIDALCRTLEEEHIFESQCLTYYALKFVYLPAWEKCHELIESYREAVERQFHTSAMFALKTFLDDEAIREISHGPKLHILHAEVFPLLKKFQERFFLCLRKRNVEATRRTQHRLSKCECDDVVVETVKEQPESYWANLREAPIIRQGLQIIR